MKFPLGASSMISFNKEFKEHLRAYALDLGFLDLRVAEAVELKQEYTSFENWLSQGLHADMAWLDRNKDKRRDIKKNPR